MGIRRTIIVLRCTAYFPGGQNPGGEPWDLSRARHRFFGSQRGHLYGACRRGLRTH
jgi:hypothetical protein